MIKLKKRTKKTTIGKYAISKNKSKKRATKMYRGQGR